MDIAQKLNFDACDIEDEELNISCRTNSSGCDVDDVLNSSAEDFESSSPFHQPRKLSFSAAMDCSDTESRHRTPTLTVTG